MTPPTLDLSDALSGSSSVSPKHYLTPKNYFSPTKPLPQSPLRASSTGDLRTSFGPTSPSVMNEGLLPHRRTSPLKASLVGREGKKPLGPLAHNETSECYFPPSVHSPTSDLFRDDWEPMKCAEPGTVTFYERAFFSLSNFFGLGDAEAQQCLPWRSKLDSSGRPTRLRVAEVHESKPYTMIRSLFAHGTGQPKHPGTGEGKGKYHLSRVELLENA